MGVCKTCPFRKSSERGALSFQKERFGYARTAEGILIAIELNEPHNCHTQILKGNNFNSCQGFKKFKEGKDDKFFSSVEEFKAHHIFKEGEPPEISWPGIEQHIKEVK